MEASDLYTARVCSCGLLARKMIDKDVYKCDSCKHATEISIIQLPYACKLFFQELMALGVVPRIITKKTA